MMVNRSTRTRLVVVPFKTTTLITRFIFTYENDQALYAKSGNDRGT